MIPLRGGEGRFPESASEHRSSVASSSRRADQELILPGATVAAGGPHERTVAAADALSDRHADLRQYVSVMSRRRRRRLHETRIGKKRS